MKRTIIVAFMLSIGLFATLAAHAGGDITPPVLVEATVKPQQIDTMFAAQTVTVTLHITDDLSGFVYVQVNYFHENGYNSTRYCNAQQQESPSTNGVIDCGVAFPRYSAEGHWLVGGIYMADAVGNGIEIRTVECQVYVDNQCRRYIYNAKATAAIRSMEIQVGSEADPHIFLPVVR